MSGWVEKNRGDKMREPDTVQVNGIKHILVQIGGKKQLWLKVRSRKHTLCPIGIQNMDSVGRRKQDLVQVGVGKVKIHMYWI